MILFKINRIKKPFHWCPNGCGKSVLFIKSIREMKSNKRESIFRCERCKKDFERKQIDNYR